MKTMELKSAGMFKVSELIENDLIAIDGEVVTILSIEDDATGDIYFVKHANDFGEQEIAKFNFNDDVEMFVFTE